MRKPKTTSWAGEMILKRSRARLWSGGGHPHLARRVKALDPAELLALKLQALKERKRHGRQEEDG